MERDNFFLFRLSLAHSIKSPTMGNSCLAEKLFSFFCRTKRVIEFTKARFSILETIKNENQKADGTSKRERNKNS